MSNPANLPATSTLLQKLVSLSAPQTEDSSQSRMTPRARVLLETCPPVVTEAGKTTPFHATLGTEAEFALASPDIDLGAVTELTPTENPSLVDMKLAYGERTAVTWLLPHVAALNAASGASNRMDAAAIQLCCRDIISAFPWLTLVEFCIFCTRMRSLRYVRRRSDYVFSSDTLMQGLREFHEDIMTERRRYEREHRQKEDLEGCVPYEEYMAMYRKEMEKTDEETRVAEKVTSGSGLNSLVQPVPAFLTQREFAARRREQLELMRTKYPNTAQ